MLDTCKTERLGTTGKYLCKSIKVNIEHARINTIYWRMLKEVGTWPLRYQVDYQNLMLLKTLLTSKEERIGKQVVKEQIKTKQLVWRN